MTTASTHSSLAGLLAGFGFLGAVTYLGQQSQAAEDTTQDGPPIGSNAALKGMHQVQTIALFTVSFILLGVASYIFSVVAGSGHPMAAVGAQANSVQRAECGRVWSQALIAMAMLALGAIAMVCNMTSLFHRLAIRDQKSRIQLRFFLLSLTGVAILGVIIFLGADTLNYLDVVYEGRIPLWLSVATAVVTVGGLGIAAYLGGRSIFGKTALPFTTTENTTLKNHLAIPVYLIVGYLVAGVVAAAGAARFPDWPDQPVAWIIVAYWVLGLLYPVTVVVWLVHASPPRRPSLMESEHPKS